jgi:hypothetical protein
MDRIRFCACDSSFSVTKEPGHLQIQCDNPDCGAQAAHEIWSECQYRW